MHVSICSDFRTRENRFDVGTFSSLRTYTAVTEVIFSMSLNDFGRNPEFFKHGRNRPSVWQTLVQVYNEFATQSTIHGIKYTTHAKSKFGRFLWLSIVSLSIVASCILANKFYDRHKAANMRTLVISNQYPSWKLQLPAITICHSNIATLHRLTTVIDRKRLIMPFGTTVADFHNSLKFLSIAIYPTNRFEKQLLILDKVLALNHLTLEELFTNISPKCEDFLVLCKFEEKIEDCKTLMLPSVTPFGICCSFNYAHIPEEHRWNNTIDEKFSVNFGARYILSILMKSAGPQDRVSSMMYGDGVKVIIHERNTYPGPTALEFVAATGHETIARLYGRRLTASVEVMRLPPKVRDCNETETKDYHYRADNCYVECRERAFLRLCGCLPFYSSEIKYGQTICNISHVSCLARVKQKAYSLNLRDETCGCLPDCQNTMYSLMTTTLPFNAPQFRPSTFYKKAMTIPNATAIHITYSEQSAMLQKRELVLSWINLVSSLGGVFSLFLGCSFISIIEIIYFFFFYLIWKLRGRQDATSTQVVSA